MTAAAMECPLLHRRGGAGTWSTGCPNSGSSVVSSSTFDEDVC
jgi:hypothetical protein